MPNYAQTVQVAHTGLQIVNSEVHWVRINASGKEAGFEPEKQPIMCDFEVYSIDGKPSEFYILLVVDMENTRNSADVLNFSISTINFFQYRPDAVATALPEEGEARWGLYANALSIAIGLVRGYLTNYLAPTRYRDYILPLLDINSIANKKYFGTEFPAAPPSAVNEKPLFKPAT